ncbi:transposase [Aminobacter sp. LjRoot7]
MMKRDHFWLTEEQFRRIEPHLPADTRRKERVDDRRGIRAVTSGSEVGRRWVDAPPDYWPRKTLHNRHVRWANGVWSDLFHALANAGPPEQVLITRNAVRRIARL